MSAPGCIGDCERDDGFMCPDDACRIEQGLVEAPSLARATGRCLALPIGLAHDDCTLCGAKAGAPCSYPG